MTESSPPVPNPIAGVVVGPDMVTSAGYSAQRDKVHARLLKRRLAILDACADDLRTSHYLATELGWCRETMLNDGAHLVAEGMLISRRGSPGGGYETTMHGAHFLATHRE